MKRKISILLVLALLISLVSACGPSSEEPPEQTSSGDPEATAAPEEEVNLTVWVYEEFYREGEESAIREYTDKFEADNPGITVEFIPVAYGSSSYRDKYIQAANGGSGPDVILSDNVWVPQLAAMEIIQPLTDKLGAKKDEFFQGTIEAATWSDDIYGVPFHTDVMVLFYNKDMFSAAGLDPEKPPTTWDEFEEYALQLKAADMDAFGFMGGWGGSFEWLPFFWQNNGEIVDSEGKIAFNNEQGMEATEYFLNLITVEEIIPEASLTWKTWDEIVAGFTNQSFAMCEGMDVLLQGLYGSEPSFEWGVAELPAKERKASMLGGGHWVINTNSKQTDAAWQWVDYISSVDCLSMMDAYARTSARVDSSEQEIIKNDPNKQIFVAALEYAQPRPIMSQWTTIDYDCIQPAFMEVLFEGRDIHEAMAEAESKAQAVLDEYE